MAEGFTENGYFPRRFESVLSDVQTEYANNVDGDPDYNEDEFLGAMTKVVALEIVRQSEDQQANFDARFLSNAQGVHADGIAEINGVTRQAASFSTVEIAFIGEADATKPVDVSAGQVLEGGGADDTARWETVEPGTIPAAGDPNNDDRPFTLIQAQATEKGPISAQGGTYNTASGDIVSGSVSPGEIDDLITSVRGVSEVTHNDDATEGQRRESDAELVARVRERQRQSRLSLQNQLRQLDQIDTAVVQENDGGQEQTIGPFTDVPPHAAVVVVRIQDGIDPSNLEEGLESEIFDLLFEVSPETIELWDDDPNDTGGNSIVNSTLRTDTRPDDWIEPKELAYHTAVEVSITADINLNLASGVQLSDIESDFTDAVNEYISSTTVGENLFALQVQQIAARDFQGEIDNVPAVSFNSTSDTLPINEVEIAIPDTVNLTSV
jgi:uncharacterized phage protein gp47/JayE